MKNLFTFCLVMCVVASLSFFSGCLEEKSYTKVKFKPLPIKVKDMTCSEGKWIDKKTYTFDSEMKILSFYSDIEEGTLFYPRRHIINMSVEISLDKEGAKPRIKNLQLSLELTSDQLAFYKKSEEGKVYPVHVTIIKGREFSRGSWMSFEVKEGFVHKIFVTKSFANKLIDLVENLGK